MALSHICEINGLLQEKQSITTRTFSLKFKYLLSALLTLPVSTTPKVDLSSWGCNYGPYELSNDGQSTSQLLLYKQWLLQSVKTVNCYGRTQSIHLPYKCTVVLRNLALAFDELDAFKAAKWKRQEDQARREQEKKGYLKCIGMASYREVELGSRLLDRATITKHRTRSCNVLPSHRCPASPLWGFH